MPYRRVLFLFSQGMRVEADQDLRAYRVAAAVNNAEFADRFIEAKSDLVGEIYKWNEVIVINADDYADENALDPEFDREKLRSLKVRFGA